MPPEKVNQPVPPSGASEPLAVPPLPSAPAPEVSSTQKPAQEIETSSVKEPLSPAVAPAPVTPPPALVSPTPGAPATPAPQIPTTPSLSKPIPPPPAPTTATTPLPVPTVPVSQTRIDPPPNKPIPPFTPPNQPFKTPSETFAPQPKPEPVKQNSLIRPLRTYRDDISSLMRKGGVSYLSMATAQYTKAKPTAPTEPGKQKNRVLALMSLALILIGIGTISYVVFFYSPQTPSQTLGVIPLIFAEAEGELDITGQNRLILINTLRAKQTIIDQKIGSIAFLYFVTSVSATESSPAVKKIVSANDFLRILETRLPAAALRSLADAFMFGYHEANGNQPFLILKTTSYDQAFSGMLTWEPFMRRDLAPLFGPAAAPAGAAATSTSAESDVFRDRVVKNRDTRILYNSDGSIALIYGLPDPSTVVIANNEGTFIELVSRLATSRTK